MSARTMKALIKAAAVSTLLMASANGANAALITWDFSGSGGTLAGSQSFLDTGGTYSLTAMALSNEAQAGDNPRLHQTSSGLGVRIVGFDSRQIDNTGHDEAIIFNLGGLFSLDGMTITLASFNDQYRILGNNSGVFTSGACGANCYVGDLLASGFGTGLGGTVNVSLPGAPPYQYLIATLPAGSGDGYRVKSIQANVYATAVPEPASLGLFLIGLAGLGFAARRGRGGRAMQRA